jgi:hypothetical protein
MAEARRRPEGPPPHPTPWHNPPHHTLGNQTLGLPFFARTNAELIVGS